MWIIFWGIGNMKKIIMMLTIIFIFLGYNNTFAELINKEEVKTVEFTVDRDDYYKIVNEKGNKISKA